MARTTPTLVAGIIDVDSGDDVTPYIETANQLVTEICAPAGYTGERLTMIETWLSCHFYDINRPRSAQNAVGGGGGTTSEAYERVQVDLYLNNTKYGQQAIMLDTAGGLAALVNKAKKFGGGKRSVEWLGTPPWEQPLAPPW